MIIINKDRIGNIEYGSKKYNEVYNRYMKYYVILKDRSQYYHTKDDIIKDMIQDGICFSLTLNSYNIYKLDRMVLVSISLCYVGTNKFLGIIEKEYYDQLNDMYGDSEGNEKGCLMVDI